MNSKILLLIALISSVLLSGCLEAPQPKEYQIIQISRDDGEYHVIYHHDGYNQTLRTTLSTKNDMVIYSYKTRLVDECKGGFGNCWVLYVNNSDVIQE